MKSKRNLVKNREIALAGIALSLSIIFLGLSYVIPFSSFLMIIFIPFLSALLAIRSSLKNQFIFLLAVVLISFIDIQEGLFYLIPNVIIGLVYGNLVNFKLDRSLLFLGTSTISFLLSYVAIYLINFIYKIDLFLVFSNLFRLEESQFKLIAPLFFFALSVIQTLIMTLTVQDEMKKFNVSTYDNRYQFYILVGINLLFYLLSLLIKNKAISYLLLGYSVLYGTINIIYEFSYKCKINKIILLILLIISIFVSLYIFVGIGNNLNSLVLAPQIITIIISCIFITMYSYMYKHEKLTLNSFYFDNNMVE